MAAIALGSQTGHCLTPREHSHPHQGSFPATLRGTLAPHRELDLVTLSTILDHDQDRAPAILKGHSVLHQDKVLVTRREPSALHHVKALATQNATLVLHQDQLRVITNREASDHSNVRCLVVWSVTLGHL